MNRSLLLSLLALSLLFVAGCDVGDDDDVSDDDDDTVAVQVELSGAVEKGPFILGTTVSVSPVDSSGNPTGEVFNTSTTNDLGEFQVNFAASGYVSMEADGYYYNEVTGSLSASTLTLRAFHDVGTGGPQDAYLNLMTHLAHTRIQALVSNGSSFTDAIDQAEQEVRDSLGVGPVGYDPGALGTELNILGGDIDPNAYLFAVSAVVAQAADIEAGPGGPGDATLQELINNISADLAADGLLDPNTAQDLLDAQTLVDPEDVMDKLTDRLADLGSTADVPDLNRFIDTDLDSVANAFDNCRYEPNITQDDVDLDDVGAACDCDDNDPALGDTAFDADCDSSLSGDDCDDNDGALGPIANDADCDGSVTAADCDDNDPDSHPGAPEIWGDGIDQNCDGISDVAIGSCTASFDVNFPDGSSTTLDGCLDWSFDAAFEYDPDDPPEVRSFTLNFGATPEAAFDCEIVIVQEDVCGTGYYDMATGSAGTTTYALMDCTGVADEFEDEYTSSTGYLRIDTLDAGSVSGDFSGQPLATTVEGYLSVEDSTGVQLSGSFSVNLEQITVDEDEQDVCAVSDGDEDDDGELDAYYDGLDCDDTDAAINPGATEVCDGIDNDCDGLDDMGNPGVDDEETDNDGDGQWECQGDCDDTDVLNFLANTEVCDGQDNDCNGLDDAGNPGVDDEETDDDGDGQWECEGDCDDNDLANLSGNPELCDGQDNDCNGLDDMGNPGVDGEETDDDADGLSECDGDCDDSDVALGGVANDADCDGVLTAVDCDDSDPTNTIDSSLDPNCGVFECPAPFAAVPVIDDLTCSSAVFSNLGPGASLLGGDLASASYSCGLPWAPLSQNGPEHVYSFNCQQSGSIKIDITGLNCDLDAYILDDSCDPSSGCLEGTTASFSTSASLSFTCTANNTYLIVVEGYGWSFSGANSCNGGEGDYELSVDMTASTGCP